MKKIFLGFISALTLLIFVSGCDQLVEKQEKLKTSTEVAKAYIEGLGKLADESYVTDSEINEIKQYTEGTAAMMQEEIKDRINSGDSTIRKLARAIAKGYISVTVDDPGHNNLHTAKVYCGDKVFEYDKEDYVLTIKLKRLDSNSKWYIYEFWNFL